MGNDYKKKHSIDNVNSFDLYDQYSVLDDDILLKSEEKIIDENSNNVDFFNEDFKKLKHKEKEKYPICIESYIENSEILLKMNKIITFIKRFASEFKNSEAIYLKENSK